MDKAGDIMSKPKISILNLEPYGKCGWQWYHEVKSEWGDTVKGCYRTDSLGSGLWRDIPGNPRQVLGTCQFSLGGTKKQVYNQIRWWLTKEYRSPF